MIYRYKSSFVRPSNGTVYAAGDVVCNASGDKITLIPARDIREGKIIAAKLSITNNNTTNAGFQLFVFRDDANIPSLVDNAAFAMTAGAEEDLVGYTAFALEVTGSSGSSVAWDENTGLSIPLNQAVDSGVAQAYFGVLTATAAYDPSSPATTVDVTVWVEKLK